MIAISVNWFIFFLFLAYAGGFFVSWAWNKRTPYKKIDIQAVHNWFSLSYCSYFVMPRSILQSMPDGWQSDFIDSIEQINETLDLPKPLPSYVVRTKEARTDMEYNDDYYCDYARGRRKFDFKGEKTPCIDGHSQ